MRCFLGLLLYLICQAMALLAKDLQRQACHLSHRVQAPPCYKPSSHACQVTHDIEPNALRFGEDQVHKNWSSCPDSYQTPQMPEFSTCRLISSDTKVLEHLCNLDHKASVRLVNLIASVTGRSYLAGVNAAVLHHGENTTEKALEESDTVL